MKKLENLAFIFLIITVDLFLLSMSISIFYITFFKE